MGSPPWKIAGTRITVQGTRGKTSLALSLHSEIIRRNKSSFCKVTGAVPLLCINESLVRLRRGKYARLYENLFDIPKSDFCVLENQGITPYTMKVFNELFVKPKLIVVTNVRLDHVEDMGRSREKIARSMASSLKGAEIVFSGEANGRLNEILSKGAKRLIEVNSLEPELPGSEIPSLIDEVLKFFGMSGIDVRSYLASIRRNLTWREWEGILYFDASKVNDPDSASLLIKWLGNDPFLFIQLRKDRPGRTWAFLKMVRERWVDFYGVAVAGEWSEEFAKRVDGRKLPDSCDGADLLLNMIRDGGHPLFITGNRNGGLVGCLLGKLGVRDDLPSITDIRLKIR